MWKSVKRNTTVNSPKFLVILIVGVMLVSAARSTEGYEVGVRNLAFVELTKFFRQPTITLNESYARAHAYFNQVAVYDSARYQPYQLRLKGISSTDAEDALVSAPPQNADAYLRTLAHGLPIEQEQTLQSLAMLFSTLVDNDNGRHLYTDASGVASPFPVTLSPCAGVELMALYISEQDVAARRDVPLVLVWHMLVEGASKEDTPIVLAHAEQDGWTILRQGDFLFQIGRVQNYLYDGGFEQTVLPQHGYPHDLPFRLFTRQTNEHTHLIYEFPEASQNMILRLGGEGSSAVGLGSDPFEIVDQTSDIAYLIYGRYRTEGEANPRIGIRWLLKDAQSWDDNVSSYVVRQAAEEWTPFAAIIQSHPDASAFQYWVLNADANTQLYVDNLAILSIPLPCDPTLEVE